MVQAKAKEAKAKGKAKGKAVLVAPVVDEVEEEAPEAALVPPVVAEEVKLKAKAKAKGKTAPLKVVPSPPPKKKTPPTKSPVKAPFWCIEHSMSQVMCRTGLGGKGSTKALRFGPGKEYSTQEAAMKVGDAWVAQERKRQKLD